MKKIKIMLAAGTLMITFFIPAVLNASMPRKINFQGRLLDSAGQPVEGTREITFNIYGSAAGADLITSDSITVNLDPEGIYTAELDLSSIGDFNRELYIGIEVGGDSEMVPRFKILPAASSLYSLRSATASFSLYSSTASYALHAETADSIKLVASTAAYAFNAATAAFSHHSSTSHYASFAGTASFVTGEIEEAVFAFTAATSAYSHYAATAAYLQGEASTAAYSHISATAAFSLYSATSSFSHHAATASFLTGLFSTAAFSHNAATATYALTSATAAYTQRADLADHATTAGDSDLLQGQGPEDFFPSSGGSLEGELDMDFHNIVNVSTLTLNGDFIIKEPPGGDDMELKFTLNIDTNTAPSRAGILGADSNWNLYISTGNQAGQWSRLNN